MKSPRAFFGAAAVVAVSLCLAPAPIRAQPRAAPPRNVRTDVSRPAELGAQLPGRAEPSMIRLDATDAELATVIEMIAGATGKNFIYDDRVRGRVTIISPTEIPIEQAYAVFESVLQVKGFTTVTTPSGAIKIVPVREAKESSVNTVESSLPPPNRDVYVTRLIPLRYIESESIVSTLKPLVSKDAAMVAYAPTNTVILTESASNIRRILSILESIDVESYRDEIAVLKVKHADATVLAEQISAIYGAETATTTRASTRRSRTTRRTATPTAATSTAALDRVRILTDERTNSLIVLSSRNELDDIRQLVAKLDVPVTGGGRIHVYYLAHANAEELNQTLTALISGQPTPQGGGAGAAGAAGGAAQQLRAAVAGLSEGIGITADPATNSLVIQASQEGFTTIQAVIEKLDIQRPQVLVEALIMEVDVSDSQELGFNGILRLVEDPVDITIASATDDTTAAAAGAALGGPLGAQAGPFIANFVRDTLELDDDGNPTEDGSLIQGIIRASAQDGGRNIIAAPHILTSDNEQAEIRIGDNIPIVSSRVEAATGAPTVSSSVNVERQDIGVTLRVTPQITEGEALRLEIFQEITNINESLIPITGDTESVGVPLSNRRVENTVVVADGETIVIGGMLSDDYNDTITKVPWLGDIPVLGWLFKSTKRSLTKINLLVFLTPHIVRSTDDLEYETIRKREEFTRSAGLSDQRLADIREREKARQEEAEARGEPYYPEPTRNPVRTSILSHGARYPLERMREIEGEQMAERERRALEAEAGQHAPEYYVQAAVTGDEAAAIRVLTELVDAGYDGSLISGDVGGTVLHEVRLGPYPSIDEAQRVGGIIRRSHGLAPSVMVAPEQQ
jgi:general secretion pathway protein D